MFQFKPMDKVVCINNTKDEDVKIGFKGQVIFLAGDKMCITDNKRNTYMVNQCDFASAKEIDNLAKTFAPSLNMQKQMLKTLFGINEENKKGSNEIMKLLEIYEEKQRELFNKEYKKDKEEIIRKDEIYTRIKDFEAKILEDFKTTYRHIKIDEFMYTDETDDLLEKLEDKYDEKRRKLRDKLYEIKAHLELCETYEQKIQVLVNYGVIDKDSYQVI